MKILLMFKKIKSKIKSIKKESVIRNSFLLPILFVVIISISHVVTWYDLGNPLAWAIYLSVAIEVFALASISAASINMSRGSIWFLFSIVTSIQMIGNIFFEFNDIDVNSSLFKSWVELIRPMFEDWDMLDHKRFLAVIQGGSLPIMSLTALHFYIKFNERRLVEAPVADPIEPIVEEKPVEEKPANSIEPLLSPKNRFWGGKGDEKKEDKKPDDDDSMAKFNPQE